MVFDAFGRECEAMAFDIFDPGGVSVIARRSRKTFDVRASYRGCRPSASTPGYLLASLRDAPASRIRRTPLPLTHRRIARQGK